MKDAGRIGFVIRGNYDPTAHYEFLDIVFWGGASYVAKKDTVGNDPQENSEHWHIFAVGMDLESIVAGIKGAAEIEFRQGYVIITPENIGLGKVANMTPGEIRAGLTAEEVENALGYSPSEVTIEVDSALSDTSTNPVQNKVIAQNIYELIDALSELDGEQKTYTDTKIAELIGGAPQTLDTLKEVADAIQENETVVDALNAAIGNKVDKVAGKGLSTNDFTTDSMNKLNGAASVDELASCFKTYRFDSVGWHRVAKIQLSSCESCAVSIKRGFSNDNNECHKAELISTYHSAIFKSVYDKTNGGKLLLSNIRFVDNGSLGFIDVYYTNDKSNTATITIEDGRSESGKLWEMIADEVVPETAEGETIRAAMDFDENTWLGQPL